MISQNIEVGNNFGGYFHFCCCSFVLFALYHFYYLTFMKVWTYIPYLFDWAPWALIKFFVLIRGWAFSTSSKFILQQNNK